MRLSAHVYTSSALGGALFAFTHSPVVAAASILSGVAIDFDHVPDFLLFSGEKITLKNFFSWCDRGRWRKITVLLHSYELYGVLCVAACLHPNEVVTGTLFGTGLHLLLDQVGNRYVHKTFRLSPWFYFLTYRAAVGFRQEDLRTDFAPSHAESAIRNVPCQ